MNHLTDYTKKTSAIKILISDKSKFFFMVFASAIVHTLLIFLFLYMHIYPMVFFNIVSVALYLFSTRLVIRGHYLPVFIMAFLEIIIHSFVATLCIGWQYGFPLYIIALVPCSYYVLYTSNTGERKIFSATVLALFSFICFIGCRLLAEFITPVYKSTSDSFVIAVYNFNTICTYTFLVFFSISFILKMQHFTEQLKEQNSMLEELANVDPLTGLFNRRCANTYIAQMLEKNETFHIMMCDIDDFKKLNDSYGHDFGDIVLKGVSAIVQDEIAERGYAFRWGGEEILILCDSTNTEEAGALAENIRKKLEEHDFDYHGEAIHSTLTIGVFPHTAGEDVEKNISKADKNLYIGKNNGKNIVIM